MLRRWRVAVIDDNPEGSLEAVLLSPLVISQPLPFDASSQQVRTAVSANLLNSFLPLEKGELYAKEADVDFQIRDFETRRMECSPRRPIVEVERDFVRAWRLVGEFAKTPPDIIFLDVMFDQKASDIHDLEAIVSELEESERIGQGGRPTVREVLLRGGLFLLGKLLRSRGDVQQMPLVVLYSASRDVQNDFRPFEYASDGRFEVVEKSVLRNNAVRRKQVFRRRIRDYMLDGSVRADDVRAAVALLASRKAIGGDHDTLVKAFSRGVGSGWCFGTLFVAESVAYLSSEPARRHVVVEELEEFISPLVGDARSLVDFVESSPARLFSHNTAVKYAQRPHWIDPELGTTVNGNGAVLVSLKDFDDVQEIRSSLELALERLPLTLRDALGSEIQRLTSVRAKTVPGLEESVVVRRRHAAKLTSFVKGLSAYDKHWQSLINLCRMRRPVPAIAAFLQDLARRNGRETTLHVAPAPNCANLELLLSPSADAVKEPLATLLRAIVNGMCHHAYQDGAGVIKVQFAASDAPATLELRLKDEGPGFSDLRYYKPQGRAGDFSSALMSAASWFDVEIHSGGIKRRPTARGAGEPEASSITRGTAFVLRIPAVRALKEA
jgi:hypothetical protein